MSYHKTLQSGAGDKPKKLGDEVSYKLDHLGRPLITFLQEVSPYYGTSPENKLMKNNC